MGLKINFLQDVRYSWIEVKVLEWWYLQNIKTKSSKKLRLQIHFETWTKLSNVEKKLKTNTELKLLSSKLKESSNYPKSSKNLRT